MKLTLEEEKLIMENRKKEEVNKPKKHGILKHDLFYINSRYPEIRIDIRDIIEKYGWFIPKLALDEIKTRCLNHTYQIIVKKGTKFDCYIDDSEELWSDAEGVGVEEMNAEWAKKNWKIWKR